MKDLRVWFTLWLTAMVVLAAFPAEGRLAGPLFAGACVDGQPVLEHWDPSLRAEFTPACRSGRLTLQPVGAAGQPLAQPEDFAAWAFVRLNGQRLYNPYHDAYPYMTAAGEVRIPLRLVTEAMGGQVAWDEGAQRIGLTWRGRFITLAIGATAAAVDGQSLTLDQAPLLWLDRTMVSPELIARLFGAQVTWDPAAFQLQIRRAGVLCSPELCIKS